MSRWIWVAATVAMACASVPAELTRRVTPGGRTAPPGVDPTVWAEVSGFPADVIGIGGTAPGSSWWLDVMTSLMPNQTACAASLRDHARRQYTVDVGQPSAVLAFVIGDTIPSLTLERCVRDTVGSKYEVTREDDLLVINHELQIGVVTREDTTLVIVHPDGEVVRRFLAPAHRLGENARFVDLLARTDVSALEWSIDTRDGGASLGLHASGLIVEVRSGTDAGRFVITMRIPFSTTRDAATAQVREQELVANESDEPLRRLLMESLVTSVSDTTLIVTIDVSADEYGLLTHLLQAISGPATAH